MFEKDEKRKSNKKVLYEAQPNIIVYNKSVLWALIILGFLFTIYNNVSGYVSNFQIFNNFTDKTGFYFALIFLTLIIIALAYIIIKILSWTAVKYKITESRVIVEKGIFFSDVSSMPYNTIQDISRSQSILGKIFSVGTINLYSYFDGKSLEIKDISSPKEVENMIFENLRGTHLRRHDNFDNSSSESARLLHKDEYDEFESITPSDGHYRRMGDLNDLTLVDVKEQKRIQREIKHRAKRNKYRKEHPSYGSQDGYDTKYGSNYNSSYGRGRDNYNAEYYPDGGDYNSGYGDSYNRTPDYEGNMHYNPRNSNYRANKPYSNRNSNYQEDDNPNYGKSHRGSGVIRESYRRNPDKYFADNYEEFHQNNLDAQNLYDDFDYSRGGQPFSNSHQNQQDVGEKQSQSKPKGAVERIKSFNLIGNGAGDNETDNDNENISDREFDEVMDKAMQNMDGNIKFKPNNDLNYESYSHDGFEDDFDYSSPYKHDSGMNQRENHLSQNQGHNGSDFRNQDDVGYQEINPRDLRYQEQNNEFNQDYSYRNSQNREFNDSYRNHRGRGNQASDDNARAPKSNYHSYNDYKPSNDFGGRDSHNNRNNSKSYRKSNKRYNNRWNNYRNNDYDSSYENSDYESNSGEKTADDLFAKHSRKFKKH